MRTFSCLVSLLSAASAALAQTDAVWLRSSDGATDQPRLVVTSSTAGANAQVRVQNVILRLSSTAAVGTPGAGDVRYSGGTVLYWDGSSWLTLATTAAAVLLQATTPGTVQTGNLNSAGTAIAKTFSGSGSGLTSLNTWNVSTGTLAVARGGTGTGTAFTTGSVVFAGASGVYACRHYRLPGSDAAPAPPSADREAHRTLYRRFQEEQQAEVVASNWNRSAWPMLVEFMGLDESQARAIRSVFDEQGARLRELLERVRDVEGAVLAPVREMDAELRRAVD